MPKSKVRKKKKKTRRNPPMAKLQIQRIVKDGIEFIQDGKNVFVNNKRTQEEHEKFIAELKDRRPEMLSEINTRIDKVIAIFSEYDKIKILGSLVYQQIENLRLATGEGGMEVMIEYALSFATAIIQNSKTEPPIEILQEVFENLILIRRIYENYIMSEFTTAQYSDVESGIRFKTIIESLYVRGNAYRQHLSEIYLELFDGHREVLNLHYGFTAKDILETILQLENSFFSRMAFPDGSPHPASHERFIEWIDSKSGGGMGENGGHFIEQFGKDNPDIIIKDKKVCAYSIDELAQYDELFEIRFRYELHKKVVDQISLAYGQNHNFLNPKFKGLPLNDSLINLKPIIKIEDKYYHFGLSLPLRNLMEITEFLIKQADKKYYNEKFLGNKYSQSRDNYLEKKAAELLTKIIPGSTSYTNLKYRSGEVDKQGHLKEMELDLLIISTRANYIIEMKAGGLSGATKRGALPSLSAQLEEIVGYGAYQSYRAYRYINEYPNAFFYDHAGNKILVDPNKKSFKITVTLEHLAALISSLSDLKHLGIIDHKVDFAWTISIYDLLIFSEILESEEDLIDYLDRRIPLYQRTQFQINDEIDFLGYFLDKDLVFDEKMVGGLHSFQLNQFSRDIDNFFEKGEAKPKRKKKTLSR
jgi:hypothetical protein